MKKLRSRSSSMSKHETLTIKGIWIFQFMLFWFHSSGLLNVKVLCQWNLAQVGKCFQSLKLLYDSKFDTLVIGKVFSNALIIHEEKQRKSLPWSRLRLVFSTHFLGSDYMVSFTPGWNFSPANRAEISDRLLKQILRKPSCRLHGEGFSPAKRAEKFM